MVMLPEDGTRLLIERREVSLVEEGGDELRRETREDVSFVTLSRSASVNGLHSQTSSSRPP